MPHPDNTGKRLWHEADLGQSVFCSILNNVVPVQGKSALFFSYENGKMIMGLVSTLETE